MPHVPRVPWILVPHVPRSSRAFMPCVHRLLGALVPHVPCPYSLSCLTCLTYSFTSRVLCLAWSCAARVSCPLCSCTLILQLLKMFQVWHAHAHVMSHIFHVLCLLWFWCLNYSSFLQLGLRLVIVIYHFIKGTPLQCFYRISGLSFHDPLTSVR